MPETILLIDLERSVSESLQFSMNTQDLRYGRGLVLSLFEEFLPDNTGRYDPDNLIAIVPGLFSGTSAPSACRMLVATIKAKDKGIQVSNTSGNMPQKLGSLGIAAVVIKGRAHSRNTVVRISADGVEFTSGEELTGLTVGDTVHRLKEKYGRESAVIGCSVAGDMRMPLSSFFCTYPDGVPEYHCPRDGFGDVWGAKNLRALVVNHDNYFARECKDIIKFRELSKKLTQFITKDNICGGALPAYGSTVIMRILENGMPEFGSESTCNSVEEERSTDYVEPEGQKVRRNKNCAPMCVIGCLNRHASTDGKQYSSPAQVETQEAIKRCFGVDDYELADLIQQEATDLGISATEFVTACKTYAVALDINDGQNRLTEWIREVRDGSLTGRVIASGVYGAPELYSDIGMEEWIDRKAIEDESLFDLHLNTKYPGLSEFSALDLLYAQIFVLENLGFCIFTSFALLNRDETLDLMSAMFEAKTGMAMSGEKLVEYASECIKGEKEYSEHRWKVSQESSIPRFTKVLYRFFGTKEKTDD